MKKSILGHEYTVTYNLQMDRVIKKPVWVGKAITPSGHCDYFFYSRKLSKVVKQMERALTE